MIRYALPNDWIRYDPLAIAKELAEAKAAVLSLRTMPYQREWVEALQKIELKMEVAGTSRIEGAEFTERELEAVLKETPGELRTRSQRQAFAALQTYVWITTLPNDRPTTSDLIRELHRHIVTGADDDHCPPGQPRERDHNVTFGTPRHRGCKGGSCEAALEQFTDAVRQHFPRHDPLIQAMAAHYHLAAMHPFLDGNGRTARALEALFLQRAGLRDTCFIAMSNYYYDEKTSYLRALSEARANDHDLTPFLAFGLRGVTLQVTRLLDEIRREMKKALFRNMMFDLFNRLRTRRKRVIAERQLAILKLLLQAERLTLDEIREQTKNLYGSQLLKPIKALSRDLNNLIFLKAIDFERDPKYRYRFWVRLEWPTEITETAFFQQIKLMPKAKTHSFLQ